jgi:hypothetical protein
VQVFLDGNRENITLDYRAQLLQCMHQSESDITYKRGERPYNHLTHSHPALLHFNGGSKTSFQQVEANLLGSETFRIDGNTPVLTEGGKGRLKYRDVCAAYPALWT